MIDNELFVPPKSVAKSSSELGTVTGFWDSGKAQITFDGETEPSENEYMQLASYTPQVGDRVWICRVCGGYLIVGAIK